MFVGTTRFVPGGLRPPVQPQSGPVGRWSQEEASEPAGDTSPAKPSGKRLWVGNLSKGTRGKELREHFQQVGKVKYSNVELAGNQTWGSQRWGTVVFETPEQGLEAISRLNNSVLDEKALQVREDWRTVIVSNMAYRTGPDALKRHIEKVAPVDWVQVMYMGNETVGEGGRRKSMGWATVRFKADEDAAKALSFSGSELGGRKLVVRYD